jgi:ferredoxin
MAKIHLKGQSRECQLNEEIVDQCEEIGVIFGCRSGRCGVCCARVLNGHEFLNAISAVERGRDMHPDERLMCCTQFVKEGDVAIDYDY